MGRTPRPVRDEVDQKPHGLYPGPEFTVRVEWVGVFDKTTPPSRGSGLQWIAGRRRLPHVGGRRLRKGLHFRPLKGFLLQYEGVECGCPGRT